MSSIAIIPARGGSKRIPRKNIRPFAGTPIIAFAIRAALESCEFDDVLVSTDDEEIAEIAKGLGASVPYMRSAEASSDHATTAAVLTEVLQRRAQDGRSYALACCLYPCNPFVTAERIRLGRATLESGTYDGVLSAVRYSSPPQRSFYVRDGRVRLVHPEYELWRSQDLEAVFHDAAQFYWLRTDAFLRSGRLWSENTGVVEVSPTEVQDIDTVDDWALAEAKYEAMSARRRTSS